MSRLFGPLIENYLRGLLVDSAAPLLLTFDRDWQLQGLSGELGHYGLQGSEPHEAVALVRDLFLGADGAAPQVYEFVELPSGVSAHLHLVPDAPLWHVLLLDASGEVARQRETQQAGHDAELASAEKSRAMRRLKEVRNEIERQRRQLAESDALKTALISTLSHEFRTPLTSIFGYLHLVERSAQPDQVRALRAIRRNATHLEALAENLLEWGRGESGGTLLAPHPFALGSLAEDLGAMFEPIARESGLGFGVELVAESSASPCFDQLKLKQILINLIGNAIRYTPSGRVDTRLDWNGSRLLIEVRDTGVGIPKDQHERIFQPFQRATTQDSRGAGLGLAIVHRLIGLMNGTLTLDSAPGRGTRITVELPQQEEAPIDEVAAIEPERQGFRHAWPRGTHVLVADDDSDVRELIRVLMNEQGFRVHTASNAQAAFDIAIREQVPLVLMDLQMPGMPGTAAIFKLRADKYPGRIVALSASPTEETRRSALGAGADVFLTKPLEIERLLAAIAHLAP